MVDKRTYINGLSNDELRYEIDKIHARLKEIEMFREVRSNLPVEFFLPQLSILEKDYQMLKYELELYELVYNNKKN